jgi:hypothetical protein
MAWLCLKDNSLAGSHAMIYLYLLWPVLLAVLEISLFGCSLYCKALALSLFSILFDAVVDVLDLDSGVPYSSSNVPFPMHDFKWVFHFHA